MSSFEQKINYHLNKYPVVKKVIKRCYQLIAYSISPKIKSDGNIVKLSPDDSLEYFFGYYDKSPWDITGRYLLCMRARDTWTNPDPAEPAELIIIDTQNQNEISHVAYTHAWNVQQGCMAQWLGGGDGKEVIFNNFNGGGYYCSVVKNLKTQEMREIPLPVYSVSADGKTALSLDFSRLHRLRKGYGYSLIGDKTADEKLPDAICIWRINIETGDYEGILKYSDFANFMPRPEMEGAEHKVNHIMISPNGKRFMVLHRWFNGQRKYSRLITCNIDGSDMYLLSDDDMVSHCYWKNNEEIIAFEHKKETGNGYYLMKDKTQEYKHLWPSILNDGHPSYNPIESNLVVFDTYPSRNRMQELKVAKDLDLEPKTLAKVYAPFRYDNETRCDLHPRWSRDGKKICFDSAFEGRKGLYLIEC